VLFRSVAGTSIYTGLAEQADERAAEIIRAHLGGSGQ
jgi:hypothetical protein